MKTLFVLENDGWRFTGELKNIFEISVLRNNNFYLKYATATDR